MTAYYRYLQFGGEIPDAIIVGISSGGDTFEDGNCRSTDYTAPTAQREYWGGAGKFQKFPSDELMPIIERGYRSDDSRRVIFGHSIGGQFVFWTALTNSSLFWGHIASNPALHRDLSFFMQPHGIPESGKERSRLSVADGTLDDAEYRQPSRKWMAHWSAAAGEPRHFKVTDLAGHSHMSAPPAAFRQGIQWVLSED